jgi:hypothetical protein
VQPSLVGFGIRLELERVVFDEPLQGLVLNSRAIQRQRSAAACDAIDVRQCA